MIAQRCYGDIYTWDDWLEDIHILREGGRESCVVHKVGLLIQEYQMTKKKNCQQQQQQLWKAVNTSRPACCLLSCWVGLVASPQSLLICQGDNVHRFCTVSQLPSPWLSYQAPFTSTSPCGSKVVSTSWVSSPSSSPSFPPLHFMTS